MLVYLFLQPFSYLNGHIILNMNLFPDQDRWEDTLLELVYFRHHRRKFVEKMPGKISNYPLHKPEEDHPQRQDTTKKISNIIGKAVNYSKFAKSKKVNIIYFGL